MRKEINLATGEVVELPDLPPSPLIPETPEQTILRLESVLDKYIDEQAKSFRYESIRTMVTYENDPNPKFHAEGKGAKEFRSQCYSLALMIINEVNQGRPTPSEEELLSEMPKLVDFVIY